MFSFLFRKNQHQNLRKRRSRASSSSYEGLEDRRVLTAITLSGDNLYVTGSSGNDLIEMTSSADYQTFTVSINSDPNFTETFNRADVDKVVVNAGGGNDTVTNDLIIESTINGQSGDDYLEGGWLDDTINGGSGDDEIVARNGNDYIVGSTGNATIWAGSGNDRVYGSSGDDVIYGGGGNDVIRGGNNVDRVYGQGGNDNLKGDAHNDIINGGAGDDVINGNGGDDTLNGWTGDDDVRGSSGHDRILGGQGDDYIRGNGGDDFLFGEGGLDRIFGDGGDDFLDAGFDQTTADELRGGSGSDEFVVDADDVILDQGGSETDDDTDDVKALDVISDINSVFNFLETELGFENLPFPVLQDLLDQIDEAKSFVNSVQGLFNTGDINGFDGVLDFINNLNGVLGPLTEQLEDLGVSTPILDGIVDVTDKVIEVQGKANEILNPLSKIPFL